MSRGTARLPKNQLKVRCELRIRFSSSTEFARAITTVPGSRIAATPPTWSQWECVRTTKRIGASVTWRSAFFAAAAVSAVVPVSMAMTPAPSTRKAMFPKSNPSAI